MPFVLFIILLLSAICVVHCFNSICHMCCSLFYFYMPYVLFIVLLLYAICVVHCFASICHMCCLFFGFYMPYVLFIVLLLYAICVVHFFHMIWNYPSIMESNSPENLLRRIPIHFVWDRDTSTCVLVSGVEF